MKLDTFDFNTLPVRVVTRDGEPWFVAADVCRVLEHSNARMLIAELDEDEKITVSNADGNPRAGIPHQMNLVSESGLYALVFKSRKATARKFRKWVTSEVLPALRSTGVYEMPATEAPAAEVVSLLAFVRENCAGWALERQMTFGLTVRRYAKAMGVIFQPVEEPGVGRVFGFARPLMAGVLGTMTRQPAGPDADSQEMQALLEALHAEHGDTVLSAEVVRSRAKQMGLFPRIFKERSTWAVRSKFGWMVSRHSGQRFAGGLVIVLRRTGACRQYEVRREAPALAA